MPQKDKHIRIHRPLRIEDSKIHVSIVVEIAARQPGRNACYVLD
jgi:hypothetical protein